MVVLWELNVKGSAKITVTIQQKRPSIFQQLNCLHLRGMGSVPGLDTPRQDCDRRSDCWFSFTLQNNDMGSVLWSFIEGWWQIKRSLECYKWLQKHILMWQPQCDPCTCKQIYIDYLFWKPLLLLDVWNFSPRTPSDLSLKFPELHASMQEVSISASDADAHHHSCESGTRPALILLSSNLPPVSTKIVYIWSFRGFVLAASVSILVSVGFIKQWEQTRVWDSCLNSFLTNPGQEGQRGDWVVKIQLSQSKWGYWVNQCLLCWHHPPSNTWT